MNEKLQRMRKCFLFGAVLMSCILTAPVAYAGTQPDVDTSYSATLQKVWETVRDHFYDKNMNGIDWNHVGEDYRAKLSTIHDRTEFEQLVNQMLKELHASHTEYMTDDDIGYYLIPSVMAGDMKEHQADHIGIMGEKTDHGFLVSAVMDGSPAQTAGIQAGDTLLTADSKPFTSAGSFRNKSGRRVQITLRKEGEQAQTTVSVTPVRQNILTAFLEAMRRSARVLSVGGKRVGYVHLWTMAHDSFRQTWNDLVLGILHDTDGLILDLRDGFGGYPFGYSNVLFEPDIAWEQQTSRQKPSLRHTGYSKPIVILINKGTRSAKEYLAFELKSAHRALVVGTRSAGAFLGAGAFEIGKEGVLELAISGLKLDGTPLEAVGVSPDIEVAPQLSYTDKDSQMAEGIHRLLAIISARPLKGNNRSIIVLLP